MKFRSRRKFTPEQKPDIQVENADEEASDRGQWGNQAEFILSCLGYAMGLGNVWKFPYTCFSNGGGAYLLPYIIVLTFVGIPAFFLELIVGQFSSKGPVEVWDLSPIFRGTGIAMLLISAMISIFYTMLLAYCLYYFAMCFQKELPWDSCKHAYNTPACFNLRESLPCKDVGGIYYNNTCYNTSILQPDELEELKNNTKKFVSSSEEYFFYGVLEKSDSIDQPNGVKMELAVCLLAMWVLCFLCLIKGIQSSGKVVYFTTTFPWVVLTILLIRGALLDGSLLGVKYYLTPEWRRLGDAKVWGDAAGQIFFALGVGASGLITYASYSPFRSNIYRTALTVAIANSCTDWYAGFVVFCALGYMAKAQGTEVKDVAAGGSGLAFIVYPQVLSTLPVPQLWTAMFFFMLVLLGIDSLNAGVEALITATVDKWQSLRRFKVFVVAFWCIVFYLLGLTMCTRAGYYWLDLISYYSSGWTLVVIGIIEVIVYVWIYGTKKIMAHVKEMVGFKLYPHWWFCWTFITPVLLLAVLIFNLIYFKPLMWDDKVPPVWVPILGWLMTLSPLAIIVIFGFVFAIKSLSKPNVDRQPCGRRFLQLFKPNSNWVPAYKLKELKAAEKARKEVYKAKSSVENETQNGGSDVTDDVTQTTVVDDDSKEKGEERKIEGEESEMKMANGVLQNGDTHHVEMNGRGSGDGGEEDESRRLDDDVRSIDSTMTAAKDKGEENSVTFRNAAYDRSSS